MTAPVSMKALLEAGVHFGHQTRRWNPKMRSFIFIERNGIHVIDLDQTLRRLEAAYNFVRDLVASGDTVLFVGTKKQAQEGIRIEAQRCSMPYVCTRWLGGTLTNFPTIQARIDHLVRLEDSRERGELERLPKKEALKVQEEIARLNRHLAGIKEVTRLPGALFVIDPFKERIAVAEALRMDIPIVAMVDTNCNPDEIDYPIPSNDDAIRAIRLMAGRLADAVLSGLMAREYAEKESLEATEVEAYQETGYVASPDEPMPAYAAPPEEPSAEPSAAAEAESPAEGAAAEPTADKTPAEPTADAEGEKPEAKAAPEPPAETQSQQEQEVPS